MELNYDIEKQIGNLLITTKVLGRGSSGEVKLGKNCLNQELYAVKIITRPQGSSKEILDDDMLREITILRNLSHENIVKIHDVFPSQKYIYMVFEYCNGKSLSEYLLENNGKLHLEDIIGFLNQICNAFEILSKKNIMHRDIKPENIMFHNGIIKIVDFGYARIMEKSDPSSYTLLGTPAYMCPQILQNQHYSYKCDIWSAGVILFKMLTGQHPFIPILEIKELRELNSYRILDMIMKSKVKWDKLNEIKIPWIKDLVSKMLEIEEKDRFNWKQVIEVKNLCLQYIGKITVNFLKNSVTERKIDDKMIMENENEDSQTVFLVNFLNYERKSAKSFEKIAKLFYNLGKNKCIQVDESIGMILFYLLCQMPNLLLKKVLILMSNQSILKFSLIEQNISDLINLEECTKSEKFLKLRQDTEADLKKLEEISKELEGKIIRALQKKNNKIHYIQNFLEHLDKGSFHILEFVKTTLRETVIHFIEYYKKDINSVNFECLITFRLLQITNNYSEVFKWDCVKKKEGMDFDTYFESLKTIKKPELIKIIMDH